MTKNTRPDPAQMAGQRDCDKSAKIIDRYKLEIVNNHGDRYIRCDPAPDGSWVMFRDVAALQARADRNAAGFARVDAEARRAEFLHKQEIAALRKRVAELETALWFIKDAPDEERKPNFDNMGSYEAGLRYCAAFAHAALAGGKDE